MMVSRIFEHVRCPGINDHSLACLRNSSGAENGALIDGRSLVCLHDGSNGGTSDLALAQLAGPLACLRVGGGGSVDNGASFFFAKYGAPASTTIPLLASATVVA